MLCIGLVVLGGTIQVVHSHADDATSHADCSLCVASHATAVVAAPPIMLVTLTMVSFIETPSPLTGPVALHIFALFTRPPPAAAVSA